MTSTDFQQSARFHEHPSHLTQPAAASAQPQH